VPSRTELDTARADYARAVANVAAARAQVAQARAQVSTNQTNLAKGTIYAPVTGVVLSRLVEPGQTVAAAFNVAPLFTIAEDLSRMKLEVKVDEADVGELHEGAPASFTVDAYPGRTFPATVTRVDVGANATQQINSTGTVVTSTSTVVAYTAVLSVANPGLMLKPGMTATATIHIAHRQNVLLVPNGALRFAPDNGPAAQGGILGPPRDPNAKPKTATIGRGSVQTVWTLGADGKPKPVQVTTGDSNGASTEVSGSGLRPGMKVITGKLAALPK
jgi:HlyD family secretion protein